MPGAEQMNEEWNKMKLNEMDENKADNKSVLNRDNNKFVKVEWENAMTPYMKYLEQCLVYIRHLVLISSFSPLSLVYLNCQLAASFLFKDLGGNFYSSSNFD